MRIAVCHPQTPFVSGGAEAHVHGLLGALRDAGHHAEAVTVPYKWYPPTQIVHQMGVWRTIDLREANGQPIDLVIAMKFPAYLIRHPRKVVWLIHQHRTAYELWDHPTFADLSRYADGPAIREMIHVADRLAFGEATRLFTNSENVRGRLATSLGIESEVLYHRSPLTDRLLEREPRELGDYMLYPSRFDTLKRQTLAIDAMISVRRGVRLILVGAGPELDNLVKHIARAGLAGRVEIRERIPDDELVDLYLGALGVYFGPFDEDYGYITIEGMAAARPVVVTSDAGGPLEFAREGETGLVVEPDAQAIAAAFDRLDAERDLAATLGGRGRTFVSSHVPDWPHVVGRLLS